MPMLTIRNVSDEVHLALRAQAAAHGRSTEAEIRIILANAVRPASRLRLGDALAQAARQAGHSNADVEAMNAVRETAPAQPMALP